MRSCAGWYLFGVTLALSLCFTFLKSAIAVPIILGLILGASLPRLLAMPVAALAWLTASLISPPQRIWWDTYFFEPAFLDLIDQYFPYQPKVLAQGLILTVAVTALVGLASWSHRRRTFLALTLLTIICLGQLAIVLLLGKQLPAQYHLEPPDQSYFFDGIQLLKLLHIYKNGTNYYEAYRIAMEKDTRPHNPGFVGSSLRPPLQFWLLAQLPDLGYVPVVYWSLTIVVIFLVYLASRRLLEPLPSLLAPAVLGAYFVYPNATPFLLMPDVAGGQLILLGLTLYVLIGWRSAYVMLGVAALFREWAVGFLGWAAVVALYRWRRSRNKAQLWEALSVCLVLLVDGAIYLKHYEDCRTIAGMTGTLPLQSRLMGSPMFALSAFLHGSIFVGGRDLLVPLLGIFSLGALVLFRRETVVWLSVVPAAGLFFLLFKVGDPGFGQYYGFSFAPILLWAGCLFIGSLACAAAAPPEPE